MCCMPVERHHPRLVMNACVNKWGCEGSGTTSNSPASWDAYVMINHALTCP